MICIRRIMSSECKLVTYISVAYHVSIADGFGIPFYPLSDEFSEVQYTLPCPQQYHPFQMPQILCVEGPVVVVLMREVGTAVSDTAPRHGCDAS